MSSMGFSVDAVVTVDPNAPARMQRARSAEGLQSVPEDSVDCLELTVPPGKLWQLYTARVVCAAYGAMRLYVDGEEIDRASTSVAESNATIGGASVPFATALTGQVVRLAFAQSRGPATDLLTSLVFAEAED